MPRVSFIITHRPERPHLINCLTSIALQTSQESMEVFVIPIYGVDWYSKLNKVVMEMAEGEWLCFPNDDCYYVPTFMESLLKAAEAENSELVYSDVLYDPRLFGHYAVLRTEPKVCSIDKICFMVKRETFIKCGGFPAVDELDQYYTDGIFIENLIKNGIKATKVLGALAVHN